MDLTSLFPSLVSLLTLLRTYLYVAGFDRYLWEVVSTDKLASAWLNHVVEENFADGVVVGAWFTVVKNGKERCVKLIIENGITCLPD